MKTEASNKIHICFVIDCLSGRGGTECQLVHLINHLDRDRVEPFLVLTRGFQETSGAMVPANCPVLYFGIKKLGSWRALDKSLEFRRFLKKERIDLIQAYFSDSTQFASVVGRLSGVPVIFGARRDIGFWMTPRLARIGKFLNRFVLDRIVANAEACKRAVIEQEGAKPENVIVIPNGIETERFRSISVWSPENANSPRKIGSVGNLKPVKGQDVLIDAAKIVLREHHETQFEMVGHLEISENVYAKQIADLELENNVRLLGVIENVPEFLATVDIAVLPSRSEGLSNGLLEYMAAGRPCIATDVGGNGELIEHERNGLLVPPENPQAMADAICDLIEHPDKAARLALAARNDVTEKYDADKVADRFCDLCEEVLKTKKRRIAKK